MSRKVFFSFHYKRDAWRVGQVRNSNLIPNEDEYGYVDSAEWETIEREGDEAIRRWINEQLKHTSVTVVLIGAETADRPWVRYEILKSWERGNALVGIRIHNMKDQNGETDSFGRNPFDDFAFEDGSTLASVCRVYDWVNDNGRENMSTWVETAYQDRQDMDDKGDVKEKSTAKTSSDVLRTSVTASSYVAGTAFKPTRQWGGNHDNG